VFARDASGRWDAGQKLTAADRAAGDYFGAAVAVSEDTVIAGAYGDDTFAGSVHVFTRNAAGTWSESQKLTASSPVGGMNFGVSVAISGDTLMIGAPGDGFGAVYVFTRDVAGLWSENQILRASIPAGGTAFGNCVAVSGGTAVFGAFASDGVRGAAYVFTRNPLEVWSEQQRLVALDGVPDDEFGFSVAVSGSTVLIGARGFAAHTGAVYAFTFDVPGTWTERQKLTSPDPRTLDYFGASVALSGSTALVGAFGDDDSGERSGSAQLFTRNAFGTWNAGQKLISSDGASSDASLRSRRAKHPARSCA
jgi:hypothetical protein